MATLKNKNVVVTGGAGFIGSHLVDLIAEKEPASLVVLDNFFLGNRDNLKLAFEKFSKLEICCVDAADMTALRSFFKGRQVNVVFDLATIPLPASLENPHWSSKVIMDLALNLCELCREGCFRTLIHCSSSEAYGSAQFVPMNEEHPLKTETPYAAAKASASLLVESYYRTFGIDMAIGRPFNNYGMRQNGKDFSGIIPRLIGGILQKKTPVIFGDGLQTRDYLFVTDTARGLIALYEQESTRGQTVNLASGVELTVRQIVEDVGRLMNWNEPPRYDSPRPADVRRHCACVKKSKSFLDFKPQVKWSDGIRQTVEWYVQHPHRLVK